MWVISQLNYVVDEIAYLKKGYTETKWLNIKLKKLLYLQFRYLEKEKEVHVIFVILQCYIQHNQKTEKNKL